MIISSNYDNKGRRKSNEPLINEQIRGSEFRVIGEDGTQYGILSSREALNLAYDKELDLVLISPDAKPPVCRMMDYGKYKYSQVKKQKEAKKNQKIVEVKELRFSVNIDTNDINTKVKHAIKFLADGNKIRVSVRLRGREMARPEAAFEVLKEFFQLLEEHAQIEKEPTKEGRNVSMTICPILSNKK